MASFQPRRLLITGGAGFIGSNLTRRMLASGGDGAGLEKVVVLDALTYAGHLANLDGVTSDPRFVFDLRNGRDPRPGTIARVRAYLDSRR